MISSVRADAFEEALGPSELTIRKAAMRDIPPILELINGYAAKGVMLPRTEFELSEAIRDFTRPCILCVPGACASTAALPFEFEDPDEYEPYDDDEGD